MINATFYFLSQLEGSSLRHVFPSYMSLIFIVSNLGRLAHATATVKQSSPSRKVFLEAAALAITRFLLTIITGIASAGAGSYYQMAILTIASLFGASAMQAVVSGSIYRFYVSSAGAYAWLVGTPGYRGMEGDRGTRGVSVSMSQSFTADDEGAGLVSGKSRDAVRL